MAQSLGQDSATFWYVGYGSLMNRQTRASVMRIIPITLKGFRREWSYRNWGAAASAEQGAVDAGLTARLSPSTALNVAQQDDAQMCAVLVEESLDNLPSLDLRESGYDRLSLRQTQIEPIATGQEVTWTQDQDFFIYQSKAANHHLADEDYPILQSYVDVVISGILDHFSSEAAIEFVRSCGGFDRPIYNDRAMPIYPRALSLSAEELGMIDAILAAR